MVPLCVLNTKLSCCIIGQIEGSKLMRVFIVVVFVALLGGTALAQQKSVPKYGEEDKAKSPAEIEADKAAERAYKHSLGNIPDKGPTDPWGAVRSDSPKTATTSTASPAVKPKAKTGAAAAKTASPN
jgi:hypothetical protein